MAKKKGEKREIIGVGRLSKFRGEDEEARLSMLVSDRFQGQKLGAELVKRLIAAAKHEKIKRIVAVMSPENESMHKLCRQLNFSTINTNATTGLIEAIMQL